MKIKINQILLDVDGISPLMDKAKEITLKEVISRALLTPIQEDDQKIKMEKWDMFKKIRDINIENNVEDVFVAFSATEIVLIQSAIGKLFPPLIMGQAFEMLEGEDI